MTGRPAPSSGAFPSRRRSRARAALPAWTRAAVLVTVLAVALSFGVYRATSTPPLSDAAPPAVGTASKQNLAGIPGDAAPGAAPGTETLLVYGVAGPDWRYAQTQAVQTANLLSHGSRVRTRTIGDYRCGEERNVSAVVYIGSASDARLPGCLLDTMLSGTVPTMWIGGDAGALFTRDPAAAARLGWHVADGPAVNAVAVEYNGVRLGRANSPDTPVTRIALASDSPAVVRGWAVTDDGKRSPWAVTTGSFTYLAESPYDYVEYGGRYLAAADLLRSLVQPDAPDRHRALVRLEDVGPDSDPEQLRAIADMLAAAGAPFTVAVYPVYVDTRLGIREGQDPHHPFVRRLADTPAVVDALQYMRDRGGTIELHGYTHQYGDTANPAGVSGADWEFYGARYDAEGHEVLTGPVPADSLEWATDRMQRGRTEMTRVGLPDPWLFEFPHYTASATDYAAANDVFGVRYEQGTYFASQCPPGTGPCGDEPDPDSLFQQYFPYLVRDVYGSVVIPEDLGYLAPVAEHGVAPQSVDDILDHARAIGAVRDGVASFFYHPYLGVEPLKRIVSGIQALGYTFVTPESLLQDG